MVRRAVGPWRQAEAEGGEAYCLKQDLQDYRILRIICFYNYTDL